jgi:hypothetical protein
MVRTLKTTLSLFAAVAVLGPIVTVSAYAATIVAAAIVAP